MTPPDDARCHDQGSGRKAGAQAEEPQDGEVDNRSNVEFHAGRRRQPDRAQDNDKCR